MEPIKIQRAKLLGIVCANRKMHVEAHAAAVAGYWRKVEADLKKAASAAARKQRKWMTHINLGGEPESYKDEYDRVIAMLKLTTQPEITLDQRDFDRYVRDKWEWAESFNTALRIYGTAGVKKAMR